MPRGAREETAVWGTTNTPQMAPNLIPADINIRPDCQRDSDHASERLASLGIMAVLLRAFLKPLGPSQLYRIGGFKGGLVGATLSTDTPVFLTADVNFSVWIYDLWRPILGTGNHGTAEWNLHMTMILSISCYEFWVMTSIKPLFHRCANVRWSPGFCILTGASPESLHLNLDVSKEVVTSSIYWSKLLSNLGNNK